MWDSRKDEDRERRDRERRNGRGNDAERRRHSGAPRVDDARQDKHVDEIDAVARLCARLHDATIECAVPAELAQNEHVCEHSKRDAKRREAPGCLHVDGELDIGLSFLAHSLPNSHRRVKARTFDNGQYLV